MKRFRPRSFAACAKRLDALSPQPFSVDQLVKNNHTARRDASDGSPAAPAEQRSAPRKHSEDEPAAVQASHPSRHVSARCQLVLGGVQVIPGRCSARIAVTRGFADAGPGVPVVVAILGRCWIRCTGLACLDTGVQVPERVALCGLAACCWWWKHAGIVDIERGRELDERTERGRDTGERETDRQICNGDRQRLRSRLRSGSVVLISICIYLAAHISFPIAASSSIADCTLKYHKVSLHRILPARSGHSPDGFSELASIHGHMVDLLTASQIGTRSSLGCGF